ncbi:MAG: TIGR01777 family oxidoreductase [Thermodesulfobacteriota bacterium]|nr:TIGR01777 family oxidoreductase [Thermodesulfobacteriota bacterium]
MKIFITGGSGFVGTDLSRYLLDKGHSVIAVGRSSGHRLDGRQNFTYISADTSNKGDWQNELNQVDAAVNLAGENILGLWSDSYKDRIYRSRILTTRNLVDALQENNTATLCSASAAGYYGNRGDEILTEDAGHGDDFLAKVCIDWEKQACRAEAKGIRVVTLRFGVVLGKNGGPIKKMLPAFKFFVGGPMGNGKHWFPWIHLDDLTSAILFILENPDIKGPVNFCAPEPLRNRDFTKALASALNRPSFMTVPAFMLRLFMRELGTSLLNSQRLSPKKLTTYGFKFQYPEINHALKEILTVS